MSEFERSRLSVIEKKIRQKMQPPKIGRVVQVYEHEGANDDSNFEVDVVIDGGTDIENYVPVLTPGTDTIDVPKVGDKVMLQYAEGEDRKPHATQISWSNVDRPPVGKSGMHRRRVPSGDSPAGSGNLYVTTHTDYDERAASNEKYDLKPEQSVVQVAKHPEGQNIDPTTQDSVPLKVEVYDDPKGGSAHVSVELNQVGGSDSSVTWGMKFDVAAGTFQIVDPDGFGIEANGGGDFTWHHKQIDLKEGSGSTGPLNL